MGLGKPTPLPLGVDQTIRRELFQVKFPQVKILSPRQLRGREWLATWEEESGSETLTRFELRDLLDILELRFEGNGD